MTLEYLCAPGTALRRPTGPIPKVRASLVTGHLAPKDSAMLRGVGHAQDNGVALHVGRGGLGLPETAGACHRAPI